MTKNRKKIIDWLLKDYSNILKKFIEYLKINYPDQA